MHNNIVTVTFNPCIDKSTSVTSVLPDKKLHCREPKFEPGGGGINVARAIRKLGGQAIAVYPSGGYSGIFLNELLLREGVTVLSIETHSHTRENLIVLDEMSNVQYRFGMPGPVLLEIEWQQCLNLLEEQDAEYIVVSGSIPKGVPENLIGRIAWIAKRKNKKIIVDVSGPALEHALNEGVFMIKPNLHELSILSGLELTVATAADAAKEIVRKKQSKVVVVSLGAEGALVVSHQLDMHIKPPPLITRRSTVGAGDSMVAGIVYKLSNGWSLLDAVQYGVACGTAATMNAGTELCHLKDVEKLLSVMNKPVF